MAERAPNEVYALSWDDCTGCAFLTPDARSMPRWACDRGLGNQPIQIHRHGWLGARYFPIQVCDGQYTKESE